MPSDSDNDAAGSRAGSERPPGIELAVEEVDLAGTIPNAIALARLYLSIEELQRRIDLNLQSGLGPFGPCRVTVVSLFESGARYVISISDNGLSPVTTIYGRERDQAHLGALATALGIRFEDLLSPRSGKRLPGAHGYACD